MNRRIVLSTLAASASLCLAVTGCSGTSGTSQTGASSSATASPAGPVGTVDPPSDIEGLDKLGLSKATMSIKTAPGLSNYDEKGLTYVDPITDPAADLSVHHVTWDGKETWKASVPVPSGADPASLSPVMSFDDALGVVSYWFTTDQVDPKDSTLRLHPVVGKLHWFNTSTGQQGSDPFAEDGNTYSSHSQLVGGLQLGNDGGMSAVKVVDSSQALVSHSAQELGLSGGSRGEFYSWKGQVRFRGTEPADPAESPQAQHLQTHPRPQRRRPNLDHAHQNPGSGPVGQPLAVCDRQWGAGPGSQGMHHSTQEQPHGRQWRHL